MKKNVILLGTLCILVFWGCKKEAINEKTISSTSSQNAAAGSLQGEFLQRQWSVLATMKEYIK
jgi:hypothetical protein